jgi:hypothetical protein
VPDALRLDHDLQLPSSLNRASWFSAALRVVTALKAGLHPGAKGSDRRCWGTRLSLLASGYVSVSHPTDTEGETRDRDMKLWVLIQCPRCGYSGCAAPVNESPCPACGHREDDPGRPNDAGSLEPAG